MWAHLLLCTDILPSPKFRSKPPILAFSHFHFQFVDTWIESFMGTSKSLWWSIQVTVLTSVEHTCQVLVLGTFWISHTSLVLVVGPLWNITTSREEHCNLRAPYTVQFPSPSLSRIFHVSSLQQGHERQSGPSVVMQGKALLSVPSALGSRGGRHRQQCLPLHLCTNLVLFSGRRLIFGWYEPGNLSGIETGRKLV
jgi:hypothetical protein